MPVVTLIEVNFFERMQGYVKSVHFFPFTVWEVLGIPSTNLAQVEGNLTDTAGISSGRLHPEK